jgi:hypothetical protein
MESVSHQPIAFGANHDLVQPLFEEQATEGEPYSILPQADEIAVVKSEAEQDLAQAKPALEAAVAALNSITPKDITALKALKNPPDVIKRIFDCVLLLRWA